MRRSRLQRGMLMMVVGIVILIVGLVAMWVNMNTQTKPVDKEKTQMAASLLAKKLGDIAMSGQRMLARGTITATDLQLNTDAGTGLYGPDGTAEPFTIQNADYVSGDGALTLTTALIIQDDTGSKNLGNEGAELAVVTVGLTDAVCKELNLKAIQQAVIKTSNGVSTEGNAVSTGGPVLISNSTGDPADSGCFRADGTTSNIGYRVIVVDAVPYVPA